MSGLMAVTLLGLSTAILFGVGFGSPHLGDPLALFLGLSTMAVLLVVIAPIGATVGTLTMRGTVHRLRALLEASRALAGGDFSRRVEPKGSDEVSELQRQFNTMAGQLQGALRAQQELAVRNVRLEERTLMARDLHDSVSQDLFSLRMRLAGLGMKYPDDSELRQQLSALNTTSNDAIRHMRGLLLELRPPSMKGLDLGAALRELVETYGMRLDIAVDARIDDVVGLDADAQDALLRVTQEALANAARHSGAELVAVRLQAADGNVELLVEDNGRGFAPETARGLGLQLIRERVRELSGQLRLESGPERGTSLLVIVPIEEARR
jgi:NarL family two-component system sensor histidine kinase LiaS